MRDLATALRGLAHVDDAGHGQDDLKYVSGLDHVFSC
jgi:hypothetical protein